MGFDVVNDLFAKHSWYFRNVLVRDNYQNIQNGVVYEPIYLERFFRNLLLGEENELKAQNLSGSWTGILNVEPSKMHLVLNIDKDANGKEICLMDSPDQAAKGNSVENYLTREAAMGYLNRWG